MSNGPDPLAEAFVLYIFAPFILIVGVIYMICSVVSCHKESQITPQQRAIIEQQKPLSYKAGKATREVGSNFIKGFFSN
jgi:hypothetical protein